MTTFGAFVIGILCGIVMAMIWRNEKPAPTPKIQKGGKRVGQLHRPIPYGPAQPTENPPSVWIDGREYRPTSK